MIRTQAEQFRMGNGTILQYTPSQLIGIYFEEVATDGI